MTLQQVHAAGVLIWTLVGGNFLLAGWAAFFWMRRRRSLPAPFWGAVLLLLAVLVLQAAAGVLLFAGGARPAAGLHLLYAVLVVAVGLAQYGLRPGALLRRVVVAGGPFEEPRTLALLCFVQGALVMRAWMTGAFGR